jgi:hypothetical protein
LGPSTPVAAHRRGDGANHRQRGPPDPPQRQWRKATGRAAGRWSPCRPSPNEGGGGGGGKACGFLFPGYSLRLREPKQKAGAGGRVKNHRQPLSRYIKARARTVQDFARTHREIQTRRRNARSSNDSRTHNDRPANRPSRRINFLAGQATPLASEASDVSPPP